MGWGGSYECRGEGWGGSYECRTGEGWEGQLVIGQPTAIQFSLSHQLTSEASNAKHCHRNHF